MNLVTRHLTTLTDFSGRENREPFWLWVLAVYVGQMVVGMVVMLPFQLSMQLQMAPQIEAAQHGGHQLPPDEFFKLFSSLFTYMMIFTTVMNLVMFGLLAAAVVRRLHDGGRSGYWALPQLVMFVLVIAFMAWMLNAMGVAFRNPAVIKDMFRDFPVALFVLVWTAGFVSGVVLLVLLCLPGTDGPNRYGDDPLAEYRERRRQQYAAAVAAANGRPQETRRPATIVRPGERRWDDPA